MINYISLPLFIGSFLLGLFYIFLIGPEKKEYELYPTPYNVNNIQYKDEVNNCFKYNYHKMECPLNPLSTKTIPVQINKIIS